MITQTQIFLCHSKRIQPIFTEVLPIFEPIKICIRFAEKLTLHLLKFTSPERKITRCNFIAKAFTDLADTKRQFPAGGTLHILEIHKYPLCSFRPQINGIFSVFCNALKSFKHQIELPNIREVFAAAVWTFDVMLFNISHHFFIAPAISNFTGSILNQFVSAVTCLAVPAVHKRIRKTAHMASGNPNFRIHQDCRVQSHIVRAFLHEFFEPCCLDIVFKRNTQRSIIPCIGDSTVNFTACINKATVLAE